MTDLGLDLNLFDAVLVEPGNVDLAVKVADVAADAVLLHLAEVLTVHDADAAGCRHEDVGLLGGLVNRGHFVTCGQEGRERERGNEDEEYIG